MSEETKETMLDNCVKLYQYPIDSTTGPFEVIVMYRDKCGSKILIRGEDYKEEKYEEYMEAAKQELKAAMFLYPMDFYHTLQRMLAIAQEKMKKENSMDKCKDTPPNGIL